MNRLESVSLFHSGGSLLASFTFDQLTIPENGVLLMGIAAVAADGSQVFRYGVKYIDGESNVFVFRMSPSGQENRSGDVLTESDTEVLAPFPDEHLRLLGVNPKLTAHLSTSDVDLQTDVPVTLID